MRINSVKKKNLAYTAAILLTCSPLFAEEEWYREALYPEWGETFKVSRHIHMEISPFQKIEFLENDRFGKFLVLDGIIQATEADEFIYHEMMVHLPLLAHGNAKQVLIIGGGDGGALREVLRHKNVEQATLVELDSTLMEGCKKHLPKLSNGAFDNPKARIFAAEGLAFLEKEPSQQYDIILCDCTDPGGPADTLYTPAFYGECKRVLKSDGILVMQNGVPFLQADEIVQSFHDRAPFFRENRFYLAAVPSYAGGTISFGWASNHPAHFKVTKRILAKRLKNTISGELSYYTPSVHKAAFCLPAYLEKKLKEPKKIGN